MHARAIGPERLRDAVADVAGATIDKNLLCAEIQFVHLPAILFCIVRPLWRSVPALSILQCTTSFSEYSMSDFKQFSRSVAGLTVLVAGAAGGMGRATARVFAAEGAK